MTIVPVTGPRSREGATDTLAVSVDYVPRKREDVLELDMGDGIVVYDPASRLVHHLNPTASILWHCADGNAGLEQLTLEIAEELDLDLAGIRREFLELVAELDALGLLHDGRDDPREGPDG